MTHAARILSKIPGSVRRNDAESGIFPKLLPLLVVTGTWYLMAKKNVSSVKSMLILLVVAAAGVIIGVF